MKQIGSLLTDKIKSMAQNRALYQASKGKNQELDKQVICTLCQDRGLILENNFAKVCPCMQQRAMINRFKNAHVSSKVLQCSLKEFQLSYYAADKIDALTGLTYRELANQALTAAQIFVKDTITRPQGDGLLYTGPVGSGKTYLSGGIANALMESGRNVLFIVVPDLLDEIKATYDQHRSNDEMTEQHLMEMARNVEILILDDLGAHNYTDWTRNKLYSIINHRLNHQLRTVVTTNLGIKDLDEYIGERSTSRLIQMCQMRRLAVATDIRYLKHKEKQVNK